MMGSEVHRSPACQYPAGLKSQCNGPRLETSPNSVPGEVSSAAAERLRPVNPLYLHSGTALALDRYILGVPALSAQRSGRGGARNRAGRESTALTAANIGHLTAATRHAGAIGLTFTRMITIHWEAAGVPLSGLAEATGRFIDLLTKTLRRHGSATAWLWVHENCGPKGGHCHLLVHVPAALVPIVSTLQLGWLRRITGKPYKKRVIHSEPIGGRLSLEVGNPDLHAANLAKAVGYLLKGAGPNAAAFFNLKQQKFGGRIIGKRCGTSQNIGRKARERTQRQ